MTTQLLNVSTLKMAAAVGGSLFLAYCVYFDHKRRSDPLFKQKLRERRRKKAEESKKATTSGIPDMSDMEAVQKYFIQEVQVGEELMAMGDIEEATEHLSNAVAVCGQPQQLLQVLNQTLPPDIFKLLLEKIPIASRRMQPPIMVATAGAAGGSARRIELIDDELE